MFPCWLWGAAPPQFTVMKIEPEANGAHANWTPSPPLHPQKRGRGEPSESWRIARLCYGLASMALLLQRQRLAPLAGAGRAFGIARDKRCVMCVARQWHLSNLTFTHFLTSILTCICHLYIASCTSPYPTVASTTTPRAQECCVYPYVPADLY